jgi:hypothetical protein
MTNDHRGGGLMDQSHPSSMEIGLAGCHFSPQAQINSYRLQWRSQGQAALAARLKLVQGTFADRGQIGGSTRVNLTLSGIMED